MKVVLRPHVGIQRSPIGPIEVEHNQWIVIADGLHVGYIGKDAGSPLNLIFGFPESFVRELKKEVAILVGSAFPVAVPPSDEEVREHMAVLNNVEEGDDE